MATDNNKYCVAFSTVAGFYDMSGPLQRWPTRARAICPLGYRPADGCSEYESVPESDFARAVERARWLAQPTERDIEDARHMEAIPSVGVQETKIRAVPE